MTTTTEGPAYIILSTDRVALGLRVRPERAAELVDRYSPTAIMPAAWVEHPVTRIIHK